MKELRITSRYQLAAMVLFSSGQSDERLWRLTGITRDISMRGISFLTTAKVDVGAYIEMDVYLPSLHSQARRMKLHGEGTVLRVESTDFAKRVAAEVFFEKEPEAAVLTASVVQ